MMILTDWQLIAEGDAEYVPGVVKYASAAYGHPLSTLPDVSPEGRAVVATEWLVERIPADTTDVASRFIATKLA